MLDSLPELQELQISEATLDALKASTGGQVCTKAC